MTVYYDNSGRRIRRPLRRREDAAGQADKPKTDQRNTADGSYPSGVDHG